MHLPCDWGWFLTLTYTPDRRPMLYPKNTNKVGWTKLPKLQNRRQNKMAHWFPSKGKFLYSAVTSPQDCSKHFISLADLFNQKASQLLYAASSHAAINAQRLLRQISTTVYSQLLFHIAEWARAISSEQTSPRFNMARQDSNPGSLSQASKALPLSHCTLRKNGGPLHSLCNSNCYHAVSRRTLTDAGHLTNLCINTL